MRGFGEERKPGEETTERQKESRVILTIRLLEDDGELGITHRSLEILTWEVERKALLLMEIRDLLDGLVKADPPPGGDRGLVGPPDYQP